jgi:hypothetical protein
MYRCGQETACDQIFLCCPANKEFGIEHLKQMENSSNDPVDHADVPGMEKEW